MFLFHVIIVIFFPINAIIILKKKLWNLNNFNGTFCIFKLKLNF